MFEKLFKTLSEESIRCSLVPAGALSAAPRRVKGGATGQQPQVRSELKNAHPFHLPLINVIK